MTRQTSVALSVTALVTVFLLVLPQAQAIVVSDNPAYHVVTPPSAYDMVGAIHTADYGDISGVLVNPWFVLTARHGVWQIRDGTLTLNLSGGNQVYTLAETFLNDNADIGVVRLTRSTGLSGYGLYDANDEQYKEGIIVGYGMSGTGLTGQDSAYPYGTKRVGYNRIDGFTKRDFTWEPLEMDFDATWVHGPDGTLGAAKEALFAFGDSGGPTFIKADPNAPLLVAGIHSQVYNDNNNNKYSDYGDKGYDVRVSVYASWIRSKAPAQPATITGDFNIDNVTNALDIDKQRTKYGGVDLWYDMTGDSAVGLSDTDYLIHTALATEFGDINLDHKINYSDYNILASYFGTTGTAGWAKGDFDGDKDVDFADYQVMEANFGFGESQPLPPPPMPIPEPASLILLAAGIPILTRRRKRL
jgi:hypothetical protein